MIEDRRWRVLVCAGVSILLLSGFALSFAGETYQPKSGQLGKDVVWVGNPESMVQKMLDVAAVTPQDYVIDLGSGDGRNVIAAAKRGARAHGIEYNGELVELAKSLAAKERVSDRATFERGDVFAADFSKASVVVLFLTPEMNIRLRPKLLALKAGARIVANTFAIGDWNPDESFSTSDSCEKFCSGRLWLVPAKVAGVWKLPQGELVIKQNYQSFSGTLTSGNGAAPVSGRIRGDQIAFTASGTHYTGKVDGAVMEGFARKSGLDSKFRGTHIAR
jgi:SAM-dependent methyltransferase